MILVTGGTGLLGSHLLYELSGTGKMIRATRRPASDTALVRKIFSYYTSDPNSLLKNIEWVEADLMDYPAIEDALEGVTEIYHAGAVVSFFPKDYPQMRKVNINGTANLVNLAMEKGITKFCHVSSVATLGRAENNGIADEETHWQPSRKNSCYSQTKYAGEREVWRAMEEGLPAVIVNPSVILGPGFWNDNSGLFRLVWEGLKYYTTGINGYVDVRDVVQAMIRLMDQEFFGQRFIVSSENLSYRDLFERIAKHLGKPAPTVHVTSLLSGIAWRVEAVRSFIRKAPPEVTRDMAVTSCQCYSYSNEKIKKTLGFDFISAEDSIRETCRLFLQDVSAGS
ncbi:MAG TPA: NAD-dependent epimerase/dehydratase family protein [Bacteroidales bacterium]|nr:NAD-dependent epimerase/dehydratase family protein [Bacteroidales bacterium]